MTVKDVKTVQSAGWINQLQRQIERFLLKSNNGKVPVDVPTHLAHKLEHTKSKQFIDSTDEMSAEDMVVFVQEQYELLSLLQQVATNFDGKCRFSGIDIDRETENPFRTGAEQPCPSYDTAKPEYPIKK
ncbi:hypothetical protein EAG18_08620 [Pseudoalteromonas sp. J010]|uniref:Uncharacterized protein n=1 Tax=Pseudoalteromonas peptidolytica F12-50-A1 TaxID=1315280 RepID=A0A8I0MYH7_9GAMM|nr:MULTISPECIES: hypothetical protein [Pseudoalteromonas]MBE0347828.1 hypothetical protein [Pseudoalteromonas peptidolytica F12-50-A1]NLR15264.1 hypothetical protein [Pseudoalteromonas peptidolytica]RRS09174.1 hypothetical protein EAG18_08620 [Pseudoalteromonas sp. J010]USD31127.1 hypothetical protein J8Z24_21700 [Pseudoalteromonas sp. SCSIO 43201]GEK10799.1 hypothetical protein PPE03_30480 [Pseudoalteromonas peptidolytica]